MAQINSVDLWGRICSEIKLTVKKGEDGAGKTRVEFDIVYDHPHDVMLKSNRRPQFKTIRRYGKAASADARCLTRGDEVMVWKGKMVQDEWIDNETKKRRFKDYVEPGPTGLIYWRVRKLEIGKPFEDGKEQA